MALQRTFGIIKPNAIKNKVSGKIISMIENSGLKIIGMKKVLLSTKDAELFYAVHKGKPFFDELVKFMISGPVVVMVLEGEDAIVSWRTLMGVTNPEKASEGTIRKLYGTNIQENAVHGSDAPETAVQEIGFFFSAIDLIH
jgi:nucleoside-diphosphate kinase